MASTTPNLALPYPVPADTVDVPRDMQALALKLDGISAMQPALVSSLPGSPVDGQEIYYLADAANGVIWHLRYRSASASAYKWEVIGGSELFAEAIGSQTTSGGAWTDITGLSVTPPLSGDYYVHFRAQVANSVATAVAQIAIASGAATVPNLGANTSFVAQPAGANYFAAGAMARRKRVTLTAGSAVKLMAAQNNGTTTIGEATAGQKGEIALMPVRVG